MGLKARWLCIDSLEHSDLHQRPYLLLGISFDTHSQDPSLELTLYRSPDHVASLSWTFSFLATPLPPPALFFFFFFQLINLFLAALGLRCCARAFSSCGERGLLFVVVRRLLVMVAWLVAEHGL